MGVQNLLIVDAGIGYAHAMVLMHAVRSDTYTMMVDATQPASFMHKLKQIIPASENTFRNIGIVTIGPCIPQIFLERNMIEPLMHAECDVHFFASHVLRSDVSVNMFDIYIGKSHRVFVSRGRTGNKWTGGNWIVEDVNDPTVEVHLDQVYFDDRIRHSNSTFFGVSFV